MILGTLNSAKNYFTLYPGIQEALEFLVFAASSKPADGKYEINGSKIYASISTETGKGQVNARLETHNKYIDVQFCLEGTDIIGWKPASETLKTLKEYDSEKDITFFSDAPRESFAVSGDTFCILFPHDAHAPLSGTGSLRKIVIKIAV